LAKNNLETIFGKITKIPEAVHYTASFAHQTSNRSPPINLSPNGVIQKPKCKYFECTLRGSGACSSLEGGEPPFLASKLTPLLLPAPET